MPRQTVQPHDLGRHLPRTLTRREAAKLAKIAAAQKRKGRPAQP